MSNTKGVLDFMNRSCEAETACAIEGTLITGKIPSWLNGDLLRVGNGKYTFGDTSYKHLFDGMAMIHRFQLSECKVTYYNRYLRSDTYKENVSANRIVGAEFGTGAIPDPQRSLYERLSSYVAAIMDPVKSDNCFVNFLEIHSKLYAISEMKYIRELDRRTLDTPYKVDVSHFVGVQHATAHPLLDADGTLYNMGSSYHVQGAYYCIFKIPPQKDKLSGSNTTPFKHASIVAKIPSSWRYNPGYCHSFAMTENYFVFVEQPLVVSVLKLAKGILQNTAIAECLDWYPDRKPRFYVVEKKTGKILETVFYASKAFLCYHHINAYEQDGHIIMDLIAFDDAGFVYAFYKNKIASLTQQDVEQIFCSLPVRYTLPLQIKPIEGNMITLPGTNCAAHLQPDKSVICVAENLAMTPGAELPCINDRFTARKYRHSYCVVPDFGKPCTVDSKIIKVDCTSKSFLEWKWHDCYLSEPVFVPCPHATEEDDGILLVTGLKREEPTVMSLLILNAIDLNLICRWDFKTAALCCATIHGIFLHKSENI